MLALNSMNKLEYACLTWTGTITALDALGLDVERPDGTVVRFLNHHMERLIALCGGVGSAVHVNDKWAILRCGSYTFSITEDHGQPLADMEDRLVKGDLVERLDLVGRAFLMSIPLPAPR